MATYYAHSKFATEVDEWGAVREWVMPGDTVSQTKLGVDKEEWENLVELGLVSEDKYPDIPDDMSPAEYERTQAAAVATMAEAEELSLTPLPATTQPQVQPAASGTAAKEK